jgi:hypothetical protein
MNSMCVLQLIFFLVLFGGGLILLGRLPLFGWIGWSVGRWMELRGCGEKEGVREGGRGRKREEGMGKGEWAIPAIIIQSA